MLGDGILSKNASFSSKVGGGDLARGDFVRDLSLILALGARGVEGDLVRSTSVESLRLGVEAGEARGELVLRDLE